MRIELRTVTMPDTVCCSIRWVHAVHVGGRVHLLVNKVAHELGRSNADRLVIALVGTPELHDSKYELLHSIASQLRYVRRE